MYFCESQLCSSPQIIIWNIFIDHRFWLLDNLTKNKNPISAVTQFQEVFQTAVNPFKVRKPCLQNCLFSLRGIRLQHQNVILRTTNTFHTTWVINFWQRTLGWILPIRLPWYGSLFAPVKVSFWLQRASVGYLMIPRLWVHRACALETCSSCASWDYTRLRAKPLYLRDKRPLWLVYESFRKNICSYASSPGDNVFKNRFLGPTNSSCQSKHWGRLTVSEITLQSDAAVRDSNETRIRLYT